MRQVMPHRNNMSLRRNKCKIFLRGQTTNARCATILQQRFARPKKAGGENLAECRGLQGIQRSISGIVSYR